MPQFTVSGDDIEEINELTTDMHRAAQIADSGLIEVFEDVVAVRDALKEMSENGSVRKNKLEEQVDCDVYYPLQLLSSYGYASSSGRGGNWTYSGN